MALGEMEPEQVSLLVAAAAQMHWAPIGRRSGTTNGENAWSAFVTRWQENANGRRAKSSPGSEEHPTSLSLSRILAETGAWVW